MGRALTCNAESCKYYDEHYCTAKNIVVSTAHRGAHCSSYSFGKEARSSDSVSDGTLSYIALGNPPEVSAGIFSSGNINSFVSTNPLGAVALSGKVTTKESPRISCNAADCMYNQSSFCTAGDVTVADPNATQLNMADCTTYTPQ